MRFNITRLCGGKALMAASNEQMDIDLDRAATVLSDDGFKIKQNEEGMMLIMDWKDMEVTLYPQGKVMFHPLAEKNLAIDYATMILEKVS